MRGSTKLSLGLLVASAGMVLTTYGVIWWRLHGAKATPTVDYNAYLNEDLDASAKPEMERLKHQILAMEKFCAIDKDGSETLLVGLRGASSDVHGSEFASMAPAHREMQGEVRQFWRVLEMTSLRMPCEPDLAAPQEPIPLIGLPLHYGVVRQILILLCDDAVVSAIDGDALHCELSLLSAARTVSLAASDRFLLGSLMHASLLTVFSERAKWVLTHHPTMITSAGLRQIAAELGGPGEPFALDVEGERAWVLDWLQRGFTDDGSGNGHIVARGFADAMHAPGLEWIAELEPEWLRDLAAPFPALGVGSRKDQLAAYDRVIALVERRLGTPLHTWPTPDETKVLLDELASHGARYAPVLVMGDNAPLIAATIRPSVMRRDGLLVAIALELYRREHGDWPASLEALVPEYLPSVPMDEFSGTPMRYEVRDGAAWVWGVGSDLDDDGGVRPIPPNGDFEVTHWRGVGSRNTSPAPDGDWILFPAR
jgi:hypothetical protein